MPSTLGPGLGSGEDRVWDVTADGERFLVRVSSDELAGSEGGPELILIQNWADELARVIR